MSHSVAPGTTFFVSNEGADVAVSPDIRASILDESPFEDDVERITAIGATRAAFQQSLKAFANPGVAEQTEDDFIQKTEVALAQFFQLRSDIQDKSKNLDPSRRPTSLWGEAEVSDRVTKILCALYTPLEKYLNFKDINKVIDELCFSTWSLEDSNVQAKVENLDFQRLDQLLRNIRTALLRRSEKRRPTTMN